MEPPHLIVVFGTTGRRRLLRKPEKCRSESGDNRHFGKRGGCELPPR